MRAVRDRPLYSEVYARFDEFRPMPGSAYLHAESVEPRSRHSPEWEQASSDVAFCRIARQTSSSIDVKAGAKASTVTVPLRSSSQLRQLWRALGVKTAYLDITGLDHGTWAPLMVSAMLVGVDLRVVYVEPKEYAYSSTPTEGEIFDLSEKVSGIAPIPGLATLAGAFAESLFVPLLGFEGTRLAYILEHVQPLGSDIVPVVGVPGFRPEYPFHAYLGNMVSLRDTRAWHNIIFAQANCPFSLWYALSDLAQRCPGRNLKIAPIGTKPHAVGAVLYWMTSPDAVELVYDHPVRKADRTAGASRTSVYHLAALGPSAIAGVAKRAAVVSARRGGA